MSDIDDSSILGTVTAVYVESWDYINDKCFYHNIPNLMEKYKWRLQLEIQTLIEEELTYFLKRHLSINQNIVTAGWKVKVSINNGSYSYFTSFDTRISICNTNNPFDKRLLGMENGHSILNSKTCDECRNLRFKNLLA